MAQNTLPIIAITNAIAQLKGPYDYQETRKVVDKLSKKTHKELKQKAAVAHDHM